MKTLWAWLVFGAVAVHELSHALAGWLCGAHLRSLAIGTDVLYPENISIVWPWEEGHVVGSGFTDVDGLARQPITRAVFRSGGFFGEFLYWSVLFFFVLLGIARLAIGLGTEAGDTIGPLRLVGVASSLVAVAIAMRHSYRDVIQLAADLGK